MIDSHCHLDFPAFDEDRKTVIQRSKALGVEQIVIPGTQQSAWDKQIDIARGFSGGHFALGLHPYFLEQFQPEHLQELEQRLKTSTDCCAVGEIGLDFAMDSDRALQQTVFEVQLQLAGQFDLPVILHHRQSHNQLISTLKRIEVKKGGIVHAFSGSLQQAQTYIEMGFLLGVGGTITYQRAAKTRDAIRQVPLSSLVLETDAPDMPVCGFQGQRNSPERLPYVLSALNELRSESKAQLVAQTTDNVRRLLAV